MDCGGKRSATPLWLRWPMSGLCYPSVKAGGASVLASRSHEMLNNQVAREYARPTRLWDYWPVAKAPSSLRTAGALRMAVVSSLPRTPKSHFLGRRGID